MQDTFFAIGDEVEIVSGEYAGESGTIAEYILSADETVFDCDLWINLYDDNTWRDDILICVKRGDIRLMQYETQNTN